MDYLIRLTNKHKGFTLIEMFLVIGIMTLFGSVFMFEYNSFHKQEALGIATVTVKESLHYAQSNAQLGKGGSAWGVKISSDKIIVYQGASYSGRDASWDESIDLPGPITITGIDEVAFSSITGTPTVTGTIILTNNFGVHTLSLNAQGTVTNQ